MGKQATYASEEKLHTLTDRLDYIYTIRGKRNQLLKEGSIKNWSRMAKPPLELLQAVINDAYPPKIKIIKP